MYSFNQVKVSTLTQPTQTCGMVATMNTMGEAGQDSSIKLESGRMYVCVSLSTTVTELTDSTQVDDSCSASSLVARDEVSHDRVGWESEGIHLAEAVHILCISET